MAERTMIIAENLAPGLLDEIRKLVPEWRILAGKDPAHWQNEVKKAEVIASFRKKWKKMHYRKIPLSAGFKAGVRG